MQKVKLNFRYTIMALNVVFCSIALYLVIFSFNNEKISSIIIIERILLLLILPIIVIMSIKSLKNKISISIKIGSFLIFLMSLSHMIIDIYNIGFNRYFIIIFDMFRLGYIYPHASISFGIWNLFIFLSIRNWRADCVAERF